MNDFTFVFTFLGYFILLLLCSKLSFGDETKLKVDFKISKVDTFPHNIDQDFSINIHHPKIEYHDIYAVMILRVENMLKNKQQLYIYPGYLPKLDRRLKDTYFHIMHFNTSEFNTNIIVRFYREAQDTDFSIYYSVAGAENIHFEIPKDLTMIYKNKIHLFRPPLLDLVIETEYGHKWGLSHDTLSLIKCTSIDGFPSKLIKIKTDKPINIIKQNEDNEYKAEIEFIAHLNDHLNKVTCSSGVSSITKQMKVFHRSKSVEIVPDNPSYMRQNSTLTCNAIGNGYPESVVNWSVVNLNKSTLKYFTISSKKMSSFITINSMVPNNSHWQLNCSAMNVIPPLHHGGPYKVINITIGENPLAEQLKSARIWTVSVVVVILLIVFLVGILCFGSKVRCKTRHRLKEPPKELELQSKNYIHVNQDDVLLQKEQYYKDQDLEFVV